MEFPKRLGWNFDNTYVNLPNIFYEPGQVQHYPNPQLIIYNQPLAKVLGLSTNMNEMDIRLWIGSEFPKGSQPIHQAYAGHQFGYFNFLGDGRALLIGEHIGPNKQRFDIQLKGSGRNIYSRNGDGKASLGPMLREYIVSEAMHHLGIPTTRSLAVMKTGEQIIRNSIEQGAVLMRVASSHIRVGTFQYASIKNPEYIKELADYAIHRHYPYLEDASGNRYLLFLEEVIKSKAKLVALWQSVGFIHGVMNTDNLTISGETIDYGPCAFMDEYNPETVFSSIDVQGRYRYEKQPNMAQWGLARLAEAILPIIDENETKALEKAKEIIDLFPFYFKNAWLKKMARKLGILEMVNEDEALIHNLLDLMKTHQGDYTNTFIDLTSMMDNQRQKEDFHNQTLIKDQAFVDWKNKWQQRLSKTLLSPNDIYLEMKSHNPFVIPRNYYVEKALRKASFENDLGEFKKLLKVCSTPYDYAADVKGFQKVEKMQGYRTFCGT